ncbi:HSP18 transcriptional regulator [Saccharothrix sp. 6-C]|uniref:HSP18 transcriptional regulator n=1 Tax=Saccharothrix sp. 6-C TaxID=2781735 RepID=UPI00191732EC|nr:HSP18 transcriptional regulator [Saccharothrix sp. 6-C]QQQ79778.1 HSP18 transcriptional regulator [Saccharothrix sp. 6-C]
MAIGDYETVRAAATGEELSAGQVLSALVLLRRLRDELSGWEPQLIAAARELGTSWAELAPALGVASRQAAERRYLRLRPSQLGATAEGRVRAERDKRAADRAVSQWARDNAASLRSLAGQVGRVDVVVHDALAADDAVALLEPLMAALGKVRTSHPELAEEIQAVGDQAEEVRRDTQTLRDNQMLRDNP